MERGRCATRNGIILGKQTKHIVTALCIVCAAAVLAAARLSVDALPEPMRPLAEAAIGLRPEHYAMLMAAYLAIDGVGTACNLTGDGAIALVVSRFRGGNQHGTDA